MASSISRSWAALTPPLAEWILQAVASMGFQRMTPVQASSIPLFNGNKDIVVEAVTGSGKTLAFLIPTVQRILQLEEPNRKHHVAAIIISPTRELAKQTYDVLVSLLGFHGPSAHTLLPLEAEDASVDDDDDKPELADVVPTNLETGPKIIPQLLIGGSTSPTEDLRFFLQKSPNVLIATPGRLLEILSSPHVHCPQSSFEALILDEADRLLDLGFKEDLQRILGRLPKQRRTGLFSASVSEALDQIIRVGLRNPVKIVVKVKNANGQEEQRTPTSLQMTYLSMPPSHKIPALVQLLRKLDPTPSKTIVYLSTCAGVDYYQHLLSHVLSINNVSMLTVPLHGKHPPRVRNKNFSLFTNSTIPALLITTDVAARGLDVPQVDLVVQIDAPLDPKDFLHRCGRAGRAGRKGLSVVFLHQGREEDYIPFLQVRKTPITPLKQPPISISPSQAQATTTQLQNLIKTDRALHDKGQRAFVSWVQSYSKHQAASIFRVADLDWASLAAGWGLLKLPRMPELKRLGSIEPTNVSMNWDTYKYKDTTREKRRLDELKAGPNDESQPVAKRDNRRQESQSWSQKHEAQEERSRRREQRHAKRQREKVEKMDPEEKAKQAELDGMIAEIRQGRLLEDEAPFEGFD